MKLRLPNKLIAAIVAAASPVLFSTLSTATLGAAAVATLGHQAAAETILPANETIQASGTPANKVYADGLNMQGYTITRNQGGNAGYITMYIHGLKGTETSAITINRTQGGGNMNVVWIDGAADGFSGTITMNSASTNNYLGLGSTAGGALTMGNGKVVMQNQAPLGLGNDVTLGSLTAGGSEIRATDGTLDSRITTEQAASAAIGNGNAGFKAVGVNRTLNVGTIALSGTTVKEHVNLVVSGGGTIAGGSIGSAITNNATDTLTLSGTINFNGYSYDILSSETGEGNGFENLRAVVLKGNNVTLADGAVLQLGGQTGTYSYNEGSKQGTLTLTDKNYRIETALSNQDRTNLATVYSATVNAGKNVVELQGQAYSNIHSLDIVSGTVQTTHSSSDGFIAGNVMIHGGATLELCNPDNNKQDALGWGTGATKSIILKGDSDESKATLLLNTGSSSSVTMATNLYLQGYAEIAEGRAEHPGFNTFDGNIFAENLHNTIASDIQLRNAVIVDVAEGGQLEISGDIRRYQNATMSKTGAGQLLISGNVSTKNGSDIGGSIDGDGDNTILSGTSFAGANLNNVTFGAVRNRSFDTVALNGIINVLIDEKTYLAPGENSNGFAQEQYRADFTGATTTGVTAWKINGSSDDVSFTNNILSTTAQASDDIYYIGNSDEEWSLEGASGAVINVASNKVVTFNGVTLNKGVTVQGGQLKLTNTNSGALFSGNIYLNGGTSLNINRTGTTQAFTSAEATALAGGVFIQNTTSTSAATISMTQGSVNITGGLHFVDEDGYATVTVDNSTTRYINGLSGKNAHLTLTETGGASTWGRTILFSGLADGRFSGEMKIQTNDGIINEIMAVGVVNSSRDALRQTVVEFGDRVPTLAFLNAEPTTSQLTQWAISDSTNALVKEGAVGGLKGNGAVRATSLIIDTAAGADYNFSGTLKITSLEKTGNGTQTLSGANSYSGGTTISGGTLGFGQMDSLGTGAVTGSGTLAFKGTVGGDFIASFADTWTGTVSFDNNEVAGNLTLSQFGNANSSIYLRALRGSGSALVLQGGTVTSTVQLENTSLAAVDAQIANNATLTFSNTVKGGGNLILAVESDGEANLTFAADISNWTPSGGLRANGGTLNTSFTAAMTTVNALLTKEGNGKLNVNVGDGSKASEVTFTKNLNLSSLNVKTGSTAKIIADGNRSLGSVSLADSSLLLRSDSGVRTYTLSALNVAGTGTVNIEESGTQNLGWNSVVNIASLTNEGEAASTVKLGNAARANTSLYNVNGGSFEGEIVVNGTATNNTRRTAVQLNASGVTDKSVVTFASDTPNNNKLGLGVNADISVKGIQHAAASSVNATIYSGSITATDHKSDFASQGTDPHTITVTGDGTYATSAKIDRNINLVMSGTGTQSFSGNMSSFSGSIAATQGTLQFLQQATSVNVANLTITGQDATHRAEVGVYSGSTKDTSSESGISVSGTLTANQHATLNANLTMQGGSTIAVDHTNGGLHMGSSVTFAGGEKMNLSDDIINGLNSLTVGSGLTLFSGVDSFNIGGDAYNVNTTYTASDYFNLAGVNTPSDFVIKYGNDDTLRQSGQSIFIWREMPEPATTTLSLLALAGLAARRRRK